MTKEQAVNVIHAALPGTVEVTNLDKAENKLEFKWRNKIYRMNTSSGFIEEVQGGVLAATDTAELMQRLFEVWDGKSGVPA